jgi:hypothetical protein
MEDKIKSTPNAAGRRTTTTFRRSGATEAGRAMSDDRAHAALNERRRDEFLGGI